VIRAWSNLQGRTKLIVQTLALNKLDGFAITEMHVLSGKSSNGANFGGTVYIPNPSVMTISMVRCVLYLNIASTD
jgi:hypothetical protein